MPLRTITVWVLLLAAGTVRAAETPPDFGRPVEVARFRSDYAYSVFPVALEFAADRVHLVYLADRRTQPRLVYQVSADNGATWGKPVDLADSSMASTFREGDLLWIVAACGDTAGFTRYGNSVKLLTVDLKSGRLVAGRQILPLAGGPAEKSYGMVSLAVRGEHVVVTAVEDDSRQRLARRSDITLVVLSSWDGGRTWKEARIGNAQVTGHTSVGAWPVLRAAGADQVGIVFGTNHPALLELEKDGAYGHTEPLLIQANADNLAHPCHATISGGVMHLAFAELLEQPLPQGAQTCRFYLVGTVDGRDWSKPVALSEPTRFELPSPFTSLATDGQRIAFGYTQVEDWAVGQVVARLALSRDGGRTFTAMDLSGTFAKGSLLPTAAFDPQSKRIGWTAVALVPAADAQDGLGQIDEGTPPAFDAYLVYASSPPVPLPGQAADDALKARVAALVRQLGDPEYERREAASRELAQLGEAVAPWLEEATHSADVEIVTRARLLLKSVFPPWLKPRSPKPEPIP